ncbi:enoyl-CoA hydratase/isomerase family protein [Paracandidimonas soli]|uniref:3-hydroxyisobutyryl-CoA hydrolase n=1 Tax=Paracandidimonas soli TaxID=1917182 RepID=A0A4R3VDL8_9BURK|nr:enoyl-CoA hydratase/isomerase family protein [Paracandidimonas soli]TCV01764.1 enoyl-CoA hydratase/isomerase-like protein [Paracandidimonas soli]
MTQAPVAFELLPAAGGSKIAVATLNRPQALNSLTLEMCQLLREQLLRWRSDDGIALLVLRGAGEKAFCAGGDLQGLYRSMQAHAGEGAWGNPYLRDFFATEYRLDYLLHTYGKPVLAWGSGVVMGGGVGLFIGASHRVLTETSRFAMPEVAIGLFPDVGGSWMLGRLPKHVGRFLGMTGASIEAADTLHLGLADYLVHGQKEAVILADMQACDWTGDATSNHELLSRLLRAHEAQPEVQGPLQAHADLIRRTAGTGSFLEICENIAALRKHENPWLQKAALGLVHGSPGTARLAYTLQERARLLSLADVFRMEYVAALQCGVHGDFQEGIRALLVDKDKSPRWNPATLEQADEAWVEKFFVQPWPKNMAHPLADLES